MTKSSSSPLKACILAYPGLCSFEFGICVEVFGKARPELDIPWYDCVIVAEKPGLMAMEGGLQVQVDQGLEELEKADLILIPGWSGLEDPVSDNLCDALRAAYDRGAELASICSGVTVLAAAGLLNGRRATTHWRYVDQLAARYPDLQLEPDVLYVDEGQVLTSAGSAAGLDLSLYLVRRHWGVQVANNVAKRLVLPAHREGGQAQFIAKPFARVRGGDIAPLMDQVRASLDQDWAIGQMAGLAGLSPRTLIRRFKSTTGQSPLAWLTGERIGYARELLESTDLSVNEIAEQSGLGSPESLRHHFRRHVGVAPLAYRASFGGGNTSNVKTGI